MRGIKQSVSPGAEYPRLTSMWQLESTGAIASSRWLQPKRKQEIG